MRAIFIGLFVAILSVAAPPIVKADELSEFWAEASRTVAEGDFKGYAATFHQDAILVSGFKNTSYPIAKALVGWKQGFDDTAAGKMKAGVDFRFSAIYRDENTAHQTGMFRYFYTDEKGEEKASLVHFQALLLKKEGWKIMMEYQIKSGSEEEWNALAH
jgi:hypothetical protein